MFGRLAHEYLSTLDFLSKEVVSLSILSFPNFGLRFLLPVPKGSLRLFGKKELTFERRISMMNPLLGQQSGNYIFYVSRKIVVDALYYGILTLTLNLFGTSGFNPKSPQSLQHFRQGQQHYRVGTGLQLYNHSACRASIWGATCLQHP